ncbi:hypothetical protein ACFVT2_31685 [Streptomyces sp. NPDC058000]|uniref:hypothetical protein n=1 Tax=Streptomyces sp. NPDC058000 TaxID=3346299 RepID=UPI0036E17F7A
MPLQRQGSLRGSAALGARGPSPSGAHPRAPPGIPARLRRRGRPRLPGRVGHVLLAAARDAFTHGLHAATLCAAGVMAAVAVLVVVLLRGLRTTADAGEEAGGDHRAAAPAAVN